MLRIREDGRSPRTSCATRRTSATWSSPAPTASRSSTHDLHLLFTSPAARSLLGLTGDATPSPRRRPARPARRPRTRTASARPFAAGAGATLHFRVVGEDGATRELEVERLRAPRQRPPRAVPARRHHPPPPRARARAHGLHRPPDRAAQPRAAVRRRWRRPPLAAAAACSCSTSTGSRRSTTSAGHEAGDQLLVEVARRLNTVVRDDDLVARLGGDEFAVLVTGTVAEGEEVAQRVVDVLAMPHRTGEWAFAVGASVGVAPLGVAGGQVAFREADAALRAAKQPARAACGWRTTSCRASPRPPAPTSPPRWPTARCTLRLDAACRADGRLDMCTPSPCGSTRCYGRVRGQDLWGAAERQGATAALQEWLLRSACAEVARAADDVVASP